MIFNKILKHFLFSVCTLFFFGQSVLAQIDTAKLNQYFAKLEKNDKAMTSVCIYKNGLFEYDRAIGFADVLKKQKANVYTLYRIGSISKMFTAVMILQLIEEKKLGFDTKLEKFYPTIKNSHLITMEQLLNHHSGIANFTNQDDYKSYMERPHTKQEMLDIFNKLGSDFAPNSEYQYSNTNYVLLTFILEDITKHTYAEELLKRVCAKAILGDTHVGGKINTANNEAQSYSYENNAWTAETETDLSVPQGAGNIVSTAKDLCLFIEALFHGKLISMPMLEKMKMLKDGYGYGMLRFPFGKKWFYGHTGGIDGFQSMLGYNEEDKVAFCSVGNGYNYPMNSVAIAMLSAVYDLPYEIPSFINKGKISDIDSKTKEGIYHSNKLDMKITISKKNDTLMAQATNQAAFPLEKVSDMEYKFDLGGIKILFEKEKNDAILHMRLLQGGMDIVFDKE